MALVPYTLMSKDHGVLDFSYDDEIHAIVKVHAIHDRERVPAAALDPRGEITRRNLNAWWSHRSIPVSRQQFMSLRDQLGIADPRELAEASRGLSLTDHYWVLREGDDALWKSVNFFDNPFDEALGLVTLGQNSAISPSFASPNATLGGDLRKKWTMQDGTRVLLKAASGAFGQEPYNEIAATALHRRILAPGEFVEYTLVEESGHVYSSCASMVQGDFDLIPVADLLNSATRPKNERGYDRLIRLLSDWGVNDARNALDKMLASDYLIGNFDRHYNNFGILRDCETLEVTGMAPIYDSGSSLWMDKMVLDSPIDWENDVRPFESERLRPNQLLARLGDLDWFEPQRLEGYGKELSSILSRNPLLPQSRIDAICEHVESRIVAMSHHQSSMRSQRPRQRKHVTIKNRQAVASSAEEHHPSCPAERSIVEAPKRHCR